MNWLVGFVLTLVGLALGLWLGGFEQLQNATGSQFQKQHPLGLFEVIEPSKHTVYLTIDDGPSSLTGELLNVMVEFDATATLFLHTDHITDEAVLARTIELGHNLGHHMPSDEDWSDKSAEAFRAGFVQSHCRLVSFGEAYSGLYRPPLGKWNEATMLAPLEEAGMLHEKAYVMAGFLPWDAGKGVTDGEWKAKNRFLARRYGSGLGGAVREGDIVVFHDSHEDRSLRTQNTLISLRVFLEKLQKRGLKARALPSASYLPNLCKQN